MGTGSSISPYEIQILADCPIGYTPDISLDLQGAFGYVAQDTFRLAVGVSGHVWDVEDSLGWTSFAITPGYYDQWHWSFERARSGFFSWKCGTVGGEYGDSLDSGLLTPEVFLEPNSELTFYHWIDAESYGTNECFDGGIVEIQVDGGPWQTLSPDSGYPYWTIYSMGHPFSGQRAFSGHFPLWRQRRFDLGGLHGLARVRFRFGAGHYWNQGEGWYIDDIEIRSQSQPDIDIEPWEFNEVVDPGGTIGRSLLVQNAGGELLYFSIDVEIDSARVGGVKVLRSATRDAWLTTEPDDGEVSPESTLDVTVWLNAQELEQGGTYWGQLLVSSNDPNEPWLVVPVELEVLPGICGDVNGNGMVTTSDGYYILNYLGSGPEPATCWVSNVNGDDSVTPSDGFQILNYIGCSSYLDCGPCDFASRAAQRERQGGHPERRQ
jgi:hypothetical protein